MDFDLTYKWLDNFLTIYFSQVPGRQFLVKAFMLAYKCVCVCVCVQNHKTQIQYMLLKTTNDVFKWFPDVATHLRYLLGFDQTLSFDQIWLIHLMGFKFFSQ